MKLQAVSKSLLLPLGLLLSLGFIWGSGYSLAKFAMENGVSPLGYSFWQSLGPALLLSFFCIGKSQGCELINPRFLPYFAICGLIGIAIPNSNMYYSAAHLPAGLLAVIVNTVPIFTYPLALLAGQERFFKLRFLGILLGMVGIFMIVMPHHSLTTMEMASWAWLTLLSPLSFAVCSIYIARFRPHDVSTLASSAGMLIASALFLLPVVWANHSFYSLAPPFNLPKLVVIVEILLSSLGYLLFFSLVQVAGPVYYSLTGAVVAITGLFWGYMIFDESLNPWHISAIIVILVAITLISFRHTQAIIKEGHDI